MKITEFASKLVAAGAGLDARILQSRLVELVTTVNTLCRAQGIRCRWQIIQVGTKLQVRPVPGSRDLQAAQQVLSRTLHTNERVLLQQVEAELERRLQ